MIFTSSFARPLLNIPGSLARQTRVFLPAILPTSIALGGAEGVAMPAQMAEDGQGPWSPVLEAWSIFACWDFAPPTIAMTGLFGMIERFCAKMIQFRRHGEPDKFGKIGGNASGH